jgi:predicted transcriptional regulator
MTQKSKEINELRKKLKIELVKRNSTVTALAKELGVGRTAIYMALYNLSKKGKVAAWINNNLRSNNHDN